MREAHQLIAQRVGQRLRELRGNLTQAEFAHKLSLDQSQYSRYETGKRLAPNEVLIGVANLCGLSPEQVVWGQARPGQTPGQQVAGEISQLVGLLDQEGVEDLYFYLKVKVEEVAQRRRKQVRAMKKTVSRLGRKAL